MAVPIKLYDFPLAFYPAKARLALVEKGIPFKSHVLNILGGDALDPWFMRMNPASTLPVLSVGDKVLTQSKEILGWVDSYGDGPLGGKDVNKAAVTQWVDKISTWDGNVYAFANADAGTAGFLKSSNAYKAKYAEARAKENPDLAAAYTAKIDSLKGPPASPEAVKANDDIMLDIVTSADLALKEQPFLAGPTYTMADVEFTVFLWRIEAAGKRKPDVIDPRPNVAQYFQRMKARPSWGKALDIAGGLTTLRLLVPLLLKQKWAGLMGRY